MKSKLIHFGGLYGDEKVASQTDFLHCEPLEVRSKSFNWEISEHYHIDLFQLFFIKGGKGSLSFNNRSFEISESEVLLIPANSLHGFSFDQYINGEVLTISQAYLERIFKGNEFILNDPAARIQISYKNYKPIFDEIMQLYSKIQEEVRGNNVEKTFAIKSLFEYLFLHFYRSSFEDKKQQLLSNDKTLAHYQRFILLIKQSGNQNRNVTHYSSELGITVVHLNRICRQVVQKSALQVINDILIFEAKNYLLNTTYSIAEIAYFLNFNDPAYFNRMFKKIVGVPPGVFRRS